MNNNELIAFLTEQNSTLASTLARTIESLTAKIDSLEQALSQRDVHSQKMIAKLNSLSKIAMPKKNESHKTADINS